MVLVDDTGVPSLLLVVVADAFGASVRGVRAVVVAVSVVARLARVVVVREEADAAEVAADRVLLARVDRVATVPVAAVASSPREAAVASSSLSLGR